MCGAAARGAYGSCSVRREAMRGARHAGLPRHDALRLGAFARLSEAAAARGALVADDDEAVVAAQERPLLRRAAGGLQEQKAEGELRLPLGRERHAVAPDPEGEVVALRVD